MGSGSALGATVADGACRHDTAVLRRLSREVGHRSSRTCLAKDFDTLFAELYAETTRSFVGYSQERIAASSYHELATRFHALYERYAGPRMQSRRVVRHWAGYHRNLARFAEKPAVSSYCAAVLFGIRAHSRFDLAEAFVETFHGLPGKQAPRRMLADLGSFVLDRSTDEIFGAAMARFMHLQETRLRAACGERAGGLVLSGIGTTKGVWVELVQAWRRAAFREALRCIEEDRQIHRPYVTLPA